LGGKEIAFREEDSEPWGRLRGGDLGEVTEWVSLGYTKGSGTAGLADVEPKGQELASAEKSLPANNTVHKPRALMQNWRPLLVLFFEVFSLRNIDLLSFWFILAFRFLHSM